MAWGSGESGELGNHNYENQFYPVEVKLEENVKVLKAYPGAAHSIVLDSKN